ncbi:hypothetical protein [Pseudomonas mohnii]
MRTRLIAASLLTLVLFSSTAGAWIFLAAGAEWLAGAFTASRVAWVTNAGLRAATAKSLSLHATVGGLALTSAAIIENTPSKVPAHVMIDLTEGGTRLNPDPKRYDDATAASVDPIPKSSFNPYDDLTVLPSNWPDVISDMGSPAFKLYRDAAGTKLTKVQTYTYFVGYREGATSTTTGGFPSVDSSGWARQYNKKITTVSCGSSTSTSPNCEYHVAYSPPSELISCPAGYTRNDNVCTLQDATQVVKPEKTIPCEVTRDSSGAFQIDWKNPECNNLKTDGSIKSISSDTVEVSNASESVTAKCTAASCDIAYQDKVNDTWTNVKTGAPDSSGGREVTSIEYGNGTNPSVPGGGTGDGDGNGDGSGSGCGSTDNPCSVNDEGFKDLATDGGDSLAKLEQDKQAWLDRVNAVNGEDNHGVDLQFIPQLPKGECAPITFGVEDHQMVIDWCDKASIIRNVLGWLLYLYTAYFIVCLFFDRSTTSGSK